MNELKPCPFCKENLLELRAGKTLVHPDNGCILEGFQFSDDFIPEWERRDGEPIKCCANCKHWEDYWENGYSDEENHGLGDCNYLKQPPTAYDDYCVNWGLR